MAAPIISTEELRQKVDEGTVVVIDARSPALFDAGHLPGAVNVPLEVLADVAPKVLPSRDATFVTYGRDEHAPHSQMAAAGIWLLGYLDVSRYLDGVAGWEAAGLPLERDAVAASGS